jgi:methylphosphonate synthase
MRGAQSFTSRRVLQRGGVDYYEYRDTAMSRLAMIRPEWIRMLHTVVDANPDEPTVHWNRGHFLYQFTYFVGEVNYYYEWDGRKFCSRMETGDSVFGVPYARHSFASRNRECPGLILALTYGARLAGDAQHELAALGSDIAERHVLRDGNGRCSFAALLRMHVLNAGETAKHLAVTTGIACARIESLLGGAAEPTSSEVHTLANALRVNYRDLQTISDDTCNGIVILRHRNADWWWMPDDERPSYRITALAGSRITPYSRAFELHPLYDDRGGAEAHVLETPLHQYGYHRGPTPVLMEWEHDGKSYVDTIEPEDSFYVCPFVRHRFLRSGATVDEDPTVLLLRIGGKTSGDALLEASLLGSASLRRIAADASLWYEPRGSRGSENDEIGTTAR